MNEIANKLNLSIATVSRALSGKPDGVSEETRAAILATAEEFGYQKRRVVGKSVAFVIDKELFHANSQFYAGIIAGVEEELIRHRYYFQFNSIDRESFDEGKINLNFADLAGVIMVGIYHEDLVLKLKGLGLPFVLVDESVPSEDIQTVLIDNTDGVIRACKHLAELGHRRVAYISKHRTEATAYERFYAYKHSADLFGFDKDERLLRECDARVDSAFEAMSALFDEVDEPPTAVLAYCDIVAFGVMVAAKERGLKIPTDISIVGFDDIGLACESIPPLTTISVPRRLMGEVAVQRLLRVIQGRREPLTKVLIPTKLVERGSTSVGANGRDRSHSYAAIDGQRVKAGERRGNGEPIDGRSSHPTPAPEPGSP